VGDVAGYLEARRADLEPLWPAEELVEVSVEGRPAALRAADGEALRSAPPPEMVRLLGPFDPYLQARDRDLLVPDRSLHKALWPVLGRPGILLVDGEVAGTWRTKAAGTKAGPKLTITVTEFAPLPASVWRQVDEEAARVAEVRGASDVTVKH
jgi:hypothetical protein